MTRDHGQLIAALTAAAERAPHGTLTRATYSRYRGPSDPPASAIVAAFGSWAAALRRAGIARHGPGPRGYDRTDLIEALQRVAVQSRPEPLTWRRYDALRRATDPTGNTIRHRRHFGSWTNALRAAGVSVSSDPPPRSRVAAPK